MTKKNLLVGIDVGSTTVKIAVVEPESNKLLHAKYERHNARQAQTVKELLNTAHNMFPDAEFRTTFCGSAGQPYAKSLKSFFVQEVIANTIAIKEFYPEVRVAIELGGQDAKVVFFRWDEAANQLVTSDMRMNGSCAGGTGAFIDQIAELLNIKTEEFEAYASQGKTVYDISGRCGVFAKTDIQPLLNQGVSKEDIALSSLHAIAKQTIGGLAQGMEITPPVIFEGGPMTFIPTLVQVFKERLALSEEQAIMPDGAETMIAYGAALAGKNLYADKENEYCGQNSLSNLDDVREEEPNIIDTELFFQSEDDRQEFYERHTQAEWQAPEFEAGSTVDAWLGLDAGSTTSKFVLVNDQEEVIYTFYANNKGEPLGVVKEALLEMYSYFESKGVQLNIKGAGSTGYGEILFNKAFKTDYHTVETVSHAEAAQKEHPDVSFILDIGGQDMKAISLHSGIVTGIVLNEACSAGCGSFIETYSRSLGIGVERIAPMAFEAERPSRLGSRCTVFMNSSIITEQKNGKSESDIMAGLCRSIIENVFTKVVRLSNLDALGEVIVVQGGTFKNDAVLRAFEQYIGRRVIRPQHAGLMGAIGVALLTRKHMDAQGLQETNFLSKEALLNFTYEKQPGFICEFCSNNCNRTLITFNDNSNFITGNRCERGEVIGDMSDPETRKQIQEISRKMNSVPDMVKTHNRLLTKDWDVNPVQESQNLRIGIPRVLEFWNSLPFWKTLFKSLGVDVVLSKKSDYKVFEKGLSSVPSDTACLPAKLVHGHIQELIEKKVDRIFMPMMIKQPSENKSIKGQAFCALIQGYPIVIDKSDNPAGKHGIPFDHPVFHWDTESLKEKQVIRWVQETLGIPKKLIKKAYKQAANAIATYKNALKVEGAKILADLKGTDKFGVVLAARPYHSDDLVNHNLASYFTRLGIPVITLDGLPIENEDLSNSRMDTINSFHSRVLAAAKLVARHPNLELVQIVSFGCGHEATLTDEMIRILQELSDKEALVLKLDEGDVKGPMNIRVKSFVETIKVKREKEVLEKRNEELDSPFHVRFTKEDKKKRTILVPNLSPSFTQLLSMIFEKEGYKSRPLPLADRHAVALGKKYVHNDICYPGQINIGEALAMVESGELDRNEVAVGMAKNCEHCRAGQYATLARKALDEAGYPDIPIITTGEDDKDMHPGFNMSQKMRIGVVWGMALIDALESMVRAIRPYELTEGESNKVYAKSLDNIVAGLRRSRSRGLNALAQAVEDFNNIKVDRSVRKPRATILGEILMKYHPSANGNVEDYLEANGMEVIQPPMLDFFRMDYVISKDMAKRGLVSKPFLETLISNLSEGIFKRATGRVRKVMKGFRFFHPFPSTAELASLTAPYIDKTYAAGESWLIPAEILHQAAKGCNSFVIVQPFGCLPNHITGRGMTKTLKEIHPHIQVLSLDYDPDTSLANIENRLQMLIITARELEKNVQHVERVKA